MLMQYRSSTTKWWQSQMTLTNKAILEKQRNNAEQSVPLCTRMDETGMMETFKMVSRPRDHHSQRDEELN